MKEIRDLIRKGLDNMLKSSDVEVQERASTCLKILQLHEEFLESGVDIGSQISSLFDEELNPVAPGSQKKVPIPEGLDLEEWINDKKEFEIEVETNLEEEEHNNNLIGNKVQDNKSADRKQFYLKSKKIIHIFLLKI